MPPQPLQPLRLPLWPRPTPPVPHSALPLRHLTRARPPSWVPPLLRAAAPSSPPPPNPLPPLPLPPRPRPLPHVPPSAHPPRRLPRAPLPRAPQQQPWPPLQQQPPPPRPLPLARAVPLPQGGVLYGATATRPCSRREGGVLYVRAGVVSVYKCNWGGAARVSGRVANRCLCRLQRDGVVISENSGGALHVLDEARFNERLLIFKAESTRCAFVVRPRGGGASSAPPPDLLVSLVMPRDVDLAEAMRLAGRKTHEHGMFYESKDETSFIVPPVFVEIAGPLYHRTEGWQSLCVLRRS